MPLQIFVNSRWIYLSSFICSLQLLFVLSLSGPPAWAATPPLWWGGGRTIQEDAHHWFFAASGVSAQDADAALRVAQNNALDEIAKRAGASSSEVRNYLRARISGWTTHQSHQDRAGRNFYAWVIIRYAKEEFASLQALATGGHDLYLQAVSYANDRQWQQALAIVDRLERSYPLGMQPLFRTEKAILLAGQCYEGAERYREAKEAYERLLNTVSDPTIRRDARNALERVRRRLPDEVEARATALSRTAVLELLASQQYLAALSMGELLLEKDGQSAEALDLLARAHAGLGNLDVALEYYGMAARSASPSTFRVVRMKAQEMASQVFSARAAELLKNHASDKATWALFIDPSLKDHPDLAAFNRGIQARMAQSDLPLRQLDWLLLEEWMRLGDIKPASLLADTPRLRASCMEAGVEMADLILLVREGSSRDRATMMVQGVLYGGAHPVTVSVDVTLSQAVVAEVSFEAALLAVAEEQMDEAARIFDEMGNRDYAKLLRHAADLRRASRDLTRGSTMTPQIRADFERSIHALGRAPLVWIPQSDTEHRLSESIRTVLRKWLNGVEADFPYVGGNKRDLIAVLNHCRALGMAMNLPPIEQRHPNTVSAYAQYAERYRTFPAWALPRDIWIDADSGLSMEVVDRSFEIPFRFIPAGEGFFGDARRGKRVELDAFYIQTRETTNTDFLRFCDETGWQIPEHLIRNTGFAHPDQPVTHVSHLDAMRYAQWLSRVFARGDNPARWRCELPTEAQWEKAARLHFPFDYPWGVNAAPTSSLAERRLGAPEQATRLAEDLSITGVMGLGGNVREWCRDGWTEGAVDTIANGSRNPILRVPWDSRMVVKGGAFFSTSAGDFAVHNRRAFEPGNRERELGFRVIVEPLQMERQ